MNRRTRRIGLRGIELFVLVAILLALGATRAVSGEARLDVHLHYLRGLSTVTSRATGKATVDYVSGIASLEVHDLPELGDAGRFHAVLVHNRRGANNSVAIDIGPGGDEVVELGPLLMDGRSG